MWDCDAWCYDKDSTFALFFCFWMTGLHNAYTSGNLFGGTNLLGVSTRRNLGVIQPKIVGISGYHSSQNRLNYHFFFAVYVCILCVSLLCPGFVFVDRVARSV